HRLTGVALSQIEGLDATTSLGILSAMGWDRSRWPTVKHFTAWLGRCPHQRVSGGKVLSRRTQAGANRAATARRLAAAALHHRQSAFPNSGRRGWPTGHHGPRLGAWSDSVRRSAGGP